MILKEEKSPIIRNGEYCGYKGIIVEGTKSYHPRGYYYDLAVILSDGNIVFGREQGNYAGGITLDHTDKNYIRRKEDYLNKIKREDLEFYELIIENIK